MTHLNWARATERERARAERSAVTRASNTWSCPPEDRVYLAVPFAEKDVAKALGAHWDPERRWWFISPSHPRADFQRWLPAEVSITRPG